MNIIEIKNLHKIYNDDSVSVHAVNDVTVDIQEGGFTAIVGPSGSGKTTLLNMIGGLDNPNSGEILINGQDIGKLYDKIRIYQDKLHLSLLFKVIITVIFIIGITRFIILIPTRIKLAMAERELVNFRKDNIGFIFQAYNLIPVLTSQENVEFIMHLQGKNKTDRDKRTTELLQAVGLGEMMERRPSKLSGGQQQRVAVARALASKPKFVLADEPTANLDSKSTENLLNIMQKLNKDENITFIFSTHDQRVVNKAKRVITLEDGKIISDIRKD